MLIILIKDCRQAVKLRTTSIGAKVIDIEEGLGTQPQNDSIGYTDTNT